MATFGLPPPQQLEIHNCNAAEKWMRFELAWSNYSAATQLDEKSEHVQVATLLTVIGEEAREVYSTFAWATPGDSKKIAPVLKNFKEYCQPLRNVPFERYIFNKRAQEAGESYDQYRTALRKLSENCSFHTITADEILRDRLVFGIQNNRVRERLLRESGLTLAKTDELCRAAESIQSQMKAVGDTQLKFIDRGEDAVNMVQRKQLHQQPSFQSGRSKTRECWFCGRMHEFGDKKNCPAYGKTCGTCGKSNHFSSKCRSGKRSTVQAVLEEDANTNLVNNNLDIYNVEMEVMAVNSDDSQFVTMKLDSGNWVKFQVDTGAQCNVLPVHLYKVASGDTKLVHVSSQKSHITTYGGMKLPIVGHVLLPVSRGDRRCILNCKLVDCANVRPLLGRKACVGMKIIQYLDNDEINKPTVDSGSVFTLDIAVLTWKQVLTDFSHVFAEGPGCLCGEHAIQLDPDAQPVQHAPRRVPVALRDRLKKELDKLVKNDIICPVTKPTRWVNSLVVVLKKDGNLRICLDPKDLNRAVQREHYPLPTIEDVATRLHGAKVFTILDVRAGFNHLVLEEDSSLLTTFNSPFGRYRWKRMPFGICSAPEVFQRRMHELVVGLSGVEVVADDFVIAGYGDTAMDAQLNHDKNLVAFLKRCAENNVHLNAEKVQWRKTEVPFIGHMATSEGLGADPAKVAAITQMEVPEDVPAVQRFLGMIQYLTKFLPNLSDMVKPIRDLTAKDTAWIWDSPQIEAWNNVRTAVSSSPVLRYYDLKKEVTLQCDASQSGLGSCMMQEGQPVAYASRALTSTETRYAQIEKELLAIVFACVHFHAYIYGRVTVNVETDHKPLESIMLKPLHMAPQRLQRMLLKLQEYNLKVSYKQGTRMYVADTLSRAYPKINSVVCDDELMSVSAEYDSIDHRQNLPVSESRWQQLTKASAEDLVLSELRRVIQHGWPNRKSDVPEAVHPYFDFRDQLIVQGDLVFRGQQLVVPACLRKELMEVTHTSHIGVEGCIRRAKECLFWPRMTAELKEFISKCDTCMAHRKNQSKEPILQHEIIERPWAKVGVDLCELDGRILLVMTDYYSNYVEVSSLKSLTSAAVIRAMKEIFARFGVPDFVVTDNATCFSSAEFAAFVSFWNFIHVTSSPHYAQSNGKAENTVNTVKRLFRKCRDSGESEFIALLNWRNTPSEGIGTSPAQRLFGRRCKTLLPTARTLLQPRYHTETEARAIRDMKDKQAQYYNRGSRPLSALRPNDTVRIKLPGEDTWSSGICEGNVAPRSFDVRVGETAYRRNRRHILKTNEDHPLDLPEVELEAGEQGGEQGGEQRMEAVPHVLEKDQQPTRRSTRARKQTDFFINS